MNKDDMDHVIDAIQKSVLLDGTGLGSGIVNLNRNVAARMLHAAVDEDLKDRFANGLNKIVPGWDND